MKRLLALGGLLAGVLAVVFLFGGANAVDKAQADNGAPQGAHEFQLNIIGTSVKNDNTLDDWGGSGHRIFVLLEGKSKINLVMGDYAVLDANGTDTNGATFQLPAP